MQHTADNEVLALAWMTLSENSLTGMGKKQVSIQAALTGVRIKRVEFTRGSLSNETEPKINRLNRNQSVRLLFDWFGN